MPTLTVTFKAESRSEPSLRKYAERVDRLPGSSSGCIDAKPEPGVLIFARGEKVDGILRDACALVKPHAEHTRSNGVVVLLYFSNVGATSMLCVCLMQR